MKFSAVANLLGAAVATFPAVSASVSLRGVLPEKEKEVSFYADCISKSGTCSTRGKNSCIRLDDGCGVCFWNGNSCRENNGNGFVPPADRTNCGRYGNSNACRSDLRCDWDSGYCYPRSGPYYDCADAQNFNQCENKRDGCVWDDFNGVCYPDDGRVVRNGPVVYCGDAQNFNQCEKQRRGCFWDNVDRICYPDDEPVVRNGGACRSYNAKADCLYYGCEWYRVSGAKNFCDNRGLYSKFLQHDSAAADQTSEDSYKDEEADAVSSEDYEDEGYEVEEEE